MTHHRRRRQTDRVRTAISGAFAHQNSDSWWAPATSGCAAELTKLLLEPPSMRCAHLGHELVVPWYIDASDPFTVVRCADCVDPAMLADLEAWADPLPEIGRCTCCGSVDVIAGFGVLVHPRSLGTVISALCEECGRPAARSA